MSVGIIIKNRNEVRFKDPVKLNADTMKYWAEGGLIGWKNERTGEHGVETVKTMLLRLKGINDMIGNSRTGKGWNRPDEMREYQRFVDAMIDLFKKAQTQGMPDNAKHAQQLVNDTKAQRKARVVVPSLVGVKW